MWSFEGLQRPPGDRTARSAKWEGMARLWEVVKFTLGIRYRRPYRLLPGPGVHARSDHNGMRETAPTHKNAVHKAA